MGYVVYDVVYVMKSVWMSEHALHFVIRRGVWGWQGCNSPPPPMVFAFVFPGLSAQLRTVMMILIPLPHYGNNFATKNYGGKKMCRSPPPPPPPPRWVSFLGLAQCSARHFARIVEVLLGGVVWYSGVAGCSWWGDSTCCGKGGIECSWVGMGQEVGHVIHRYKPISIVIN